MQTVVETPGYIVDAHDAGLTDQERASIVTAFARSPMHGVLMPGTGGARKARFAGRGKGKSGGYRVISYFAGDDLPVFLLALFGKGEKTNITKAEANALKSMLSGIADAYRKGHGS